MLSIEASGVLRFAFAASLVVGAAGCDEPSPGDPCDTDPTGCRQAEEFEVDADCSEAEMSGELEVRWGDRDEVWGPQGGMHMEVGVWVGNLNEGRERALVTFSSLDTYVDEETGEEVEYSANERSVEIPADVWTAQDGGMGVASLVWFAHFDDFNGPPKFRVDVVDACGRTGRHEEP